MNVRVLNARSSAEAEVDMWSGECAALAAANCLWAVVAPAPWAEREWEEAAGAPKGPASGAA
jgi:hypothetical protein